MSVFTLENENGMCLRVLDYGCTIQSLFVPDGDGRPVDVVLGYDTLGDYESGSCYFGALVGRYANRIRNARFELNGKEFRLEKNDGENHLHGVFSRCVFRAEAQEDGLVFRRVSPDGEEGFPGTLQVALRLRLTEDNALSLEYEAETDADTVLNLTNHSYFNLNGGGTVLGHTLALFSDRYTENGPGTIPTGRILPVEGTPMDLRRGLTLGEGLGSSFDQLALCGGYDHNYCLDHEERTLFRFAEAVGDRSGIRMEAFTTQPGVQLYTGNFIHEDAAPCGKGGVRCPRFAGFCLETQHYPCSPNFPQFPTTVLRPGERYRQQTVFRFSSF